MGEWVSGDCRIGESFLHGDFIKYKNNGKSNYVASHILCEMNGSQMIMIQNVTMLEEKITNIVFGEQTDILFPYLTVIM